MMVNKFTFNNKYLKTFLLLLTATVWILVFTNFFIRQKAESDSTAITILKARTARVIISPYVDLTAEDILVDRFYGTMETKIDTLSIPESSRLVRNQQSRLGPDTSWKLPFLIDGIAQQANHSRFLLATYGEKRFLLNEGEMFETYRITSITDNGVWVKYNGVKRFFKINSR